MPVFLSFDKCKHLLIQKYCSKLIISYYLTNLRKMSGKETKSEEKKPVLIKNATDLQRLKLEKLMKNPVSRIISFLSNILR